MDRRTSASPHGRLLRTCAAHRLAGLQLISSLTLAVVTFACAAPGEEAEGEAEQYAPTAFVDEAGREWVSRGQAEFADTLELEAARDLEPCALDLYALSVEELAEALRPRMFGNGQEYTLREPDYELAADVLRRKDEVFTSPGDPGIELPPTGALVPKKVVGANNSRFPVRMGTTYPFRTVAAMKEGQAVGGTMTLIGRSTAISAAHVFHTGSKWRPNKSWSFGANVDARFQGNIQNPYNPWTAYPSTDPNNDFVFQCYWVTVPGCWEGRAGDCDYAVVEFSSMNGTLPNCDLYPGDVLGWMGWGSQTTATIESAGETALHGYPGFETCPVGGCNFPTLFRSHDGPGVVKWDSSMGLLVHAFDTSGGESGSAIVNWAEGFPKVIGIHWGSYADRKQNYATRINSTVISFVQKHSAQ